MMYSPVAIALDRRPRPPGSLPYRTAQLFTHNRAHRDSIGSSSTGLGSLDSINKTSQDEHGHRLDRTPTDVREVDEVSIELQNISEPDRATGNVGLGLPSSLSLKQFTSPSSSIKSGVADGTAQPSPPPPYGPDFNPLPSHTAVVATPPTQDVGNDPLRTMDDEEEEILRRKRATDAAKALGLAMQSSPSMSTDGSTEEGMDVEEIRIQLRQMRRRLRTRDRELMMTAQVAQNVLRQHEELVLALPDHVKSILPQLLDPTRDQSSHYGPSLLESALSFASRGHSQSYQIHSASPSPSSSQSRISATSPLASSTEQGHKLFRTVRDDDISRPFPLHKQPRHARSVFNTPTSSHTRSTTYTEAQQQESDDKLLLLERALSEARGNEEVQRKMATKLKRDFERLQREFDHVEMIARRAESECRPTGAGSGASAGSSSSTESMTSSQFDSWAWKQTQNVVTEESAADSHAMLKPKNTKVKLRIKPKSQVSIEREAEAKIHRQAKDDGLGWGLTKFPEFPGDRLTRLPPRPTFNRLKAKLRYTSPKKVALSPRRTPRRVHHQKMASTSTVSNEESYVSPSKPSRTTRTDMTPRSTGKIKQFDDDSSRSMLGERDSLRSRASLHARYDSIDSHASVTHSALNSVRSIGFVGSRSLGSELGSEFGEDGHHNNRDAGNWEDEKSGDDSTGTEVGTYSQPFALPANASSGLSSLAMALAPNSPLSTKKSRQVTPSRKRTPKRISPGVQEDGFDTGSFRPKKGRKNWIRPLQLSVARGLESNTTGVQQRPMMFPRTSSDGTVALAHRRLRLDGTHEDSMEKQIRRNRPEMELYSIPARLVNDVIVLLSILLEWVEMMIIMVWRIFVAVRYGRESIFRTWRQGRSRRYYI